MTIVARETRYKPDPPAPADGILTREYLRALRVPILQFRNDAGEWQDVTDVTQLRRDSSYG